MRIKEKKKNFNLEMERMIKQQIFALEMDALTNRLQRVQLDKTVALLHELWDKMKIGGRRKVEVTTNEDGMEVIIGELMAPTFYFTNEKKFWRQLRCIIKSSLQNEQWLKTKIHQLFVSEWKNEYFSQDGTPMTPLLLSRNMMKSPFQKWWLINVNERKNG